MARIIIKESGFWGNRVVINKVSGIIIDHSIQDMIVISFIDKQKHHITIYLIKSEILGVSVKEDKENV